MTIVDPFYLYLILQLDSIKNALEFTAFITGAAVFVALVICAMHAGDDVFSYNRDSVQERKAFRSTLIGYAKRAAVVFFASFTMVTLLPSSERMAVLVVLPAVANNEAIQGEARELYNLAKRGLEALAKPEQEEGKAE